MVHLLTLYSDPISLVTFFVGPEPTAVEFLIHRDVVYRQSSVLAAAFKGSFVEGQTQTYRLEETSPSAFRLFMEWMYSQKLTLLYDTYKNLRRADVDVAKVRTQYMSLAEVSVLADKFAVPALQNHVILSMGRIQEITRTYPWVTYKYIYQNTAVNSALRRYIIDHCVNAGFRGLSVFEFSTVNPYPPEMYVDIAKRCFFYGADHPEFVIILSHFDYYVDTGTD